MVLRCLAASRAIRFTASKAAVYNGPAMNEDGRSQGKASPRCPRCGSSHDPDDGFCRRCGAALRASRVPMVRDQRSYAPVPWRGTVPVVVRGAAVVAAGTLAEAILRRIIARAFRGRTRPSGRRAGLPARREKAEVVERAEPVGDGDHVVSETYLFRRVRLRHRDWPAE